MPIRAKDLLGRRGEQLAAEALERAGYTVLARNWRCPLGELDLVVRRGPVTAAVEVKTRSGLGYGHPFQAITPVKLERLRRLAQTWFREAEAHGELRVDAVAVIISPEGDAAIEHLRGIA